MGGDPSTPLKAGTDMPPGNGLSGAAVNKNLLRRLYDGTLSFSRRPNALIWLFTIAFVESVFFPVPPDALLIAIAYAAPRSALAAAAVCTLGSVSGAILGYAVGGLASEPVMLFLSTYVISADNVELVKTHLQTNAFYYIFAAAFTPIPYKVFTITAGIAGMSLPVLVVASILGRGGRFFLVSGAIMAFGDKVRPFVERRLEALTVAITVIVALLIYGISM